MTRLRKEFDADLITTEPSATYRSLTNPYEVPCSVCGKMFFVNAETHRAFDLSIEHGLDNTFTCYECEQEYDRLAYEK